MVVPVSSVVVSDTSVLVNFLRIDRMDLLGALPYALLATNHVGAEITDSYPDQLKRYEAALANGIIVEVSLTSDEELELFAKLSSSGRLGMGECSAIACAICRGHTLAIDDRPAITQARRTSRALPIVRTECLVTEMIRAGLLTIIEADKIKDDWSTNHRFTLTISSFEELLRAK